MGHRTVVASAPGRIDLVGWADGVYPGLGKVCNLAINLRSEVRVRFCPKEGVGVMRRGVLSGHQILFPGMAYGNPWDLYQAAVNRYQLDGLNIEASSRIPWGSGLGGSGATGVALVAALSQLENPPQKLAGLDLSSAETYAFIAQEARALETEEMGASSGWQDQYAAAFGGINLWVAVDDPQIPHRMPWQPNPHQVSAIESHLLLIKTPEGEPRNSSDIQKGEVDLSVLPSMTKNAELAFSYLQDGRFDLLGTILSDTWEYSRQLTYNRVHTSELGALMGLLYFRDAYGWKACGSGGFGSCMVASVDPNIKAQIENELLVDRPNWDGYSILRFRLDFEGVKVHSFGLSEHYH